MNTKFLAALAIGTFVAIGTTRLADAHHSFAAEFDSNKQVTLTGNVTKLEWANPHIWVYLDVKSDQGSLEPWQRLRPRGGQQLAVVLIRAHTSKVRQRAALSGGAARCSCAAVEGPSPAVLSGSPAVETALVSRILL